MGAPAPPHDPVYDPAMAAWVWQGRGPPLVALHGFGGDGRDFEALAERLSGIEVLAPELAGHGRRADAPESEYLLDAQAGRLGELVAARLGGSRTPTGAPRVVVLGYSMGGRIAALAAFRGLLPASAHLVLVGAHPGLLSDAERAQRRADDARLADAAEVEPAAFLEAFSASPLLRSQASQPEPWRSRRLARRRLGPASGAALAASLRVAGTAEQPALLDLPAPELSVSLVTGADDTKFTALARQWAGRHPGWAVHVLPGGHACHLEATDALAGVLRPLLKG